MALNRFLLLSLFAQTFGQSLDICGDCDCIESNITCIGIIQRDTFEPLPSWVRGFFAWECSIPRISSKTFTNVSRRLQKLQIVDADVTKIEPDALQNMVKLTFLDLSSNPTHDGINPKIFQDLMSLKYLNLSRLHHIDDFAIMSKDNFPPGILLEEINLAHAYIHNLSRDIRLPTCRRLILEDLPISYLTGDKMNVAVSAYTAKIDSTALQELNLKGCGVVFDRSFFRLFSNLRVFEASQAVVSNISDLEKLAQWKQLKVLNFSRIHVKGLNSNNLRWKYFPLNLTVLDLSYNMISEIDVRVNLKKLKILNLQENRLKSFDTMANFPNLVTLDFSGNELDTLPIISLQKLKHLKIARNRISTLITQAFAGFPQLETLDMSGNDIKYFGYEIFVALPRLKSLNLDSNGLEAFTLEGALNLYELRISNNRIDHLKIAPGCCAGLQVITVGSNDEFFEHVTCSGANPKKCTPNSMLELEKLTFLKILDLSYTSIRDFPGSFIESFPLLEYLSLAGNGISDKTLEEGLSSVELRNVHLRFLNLSDNQLSHIGPKTLKFLTENWVSELDLSANDYYCSCQLAIAFDQLRYKLLRYFGMDNENTNYQCYSESDAWSYPIKNFLFQRRVQEACLSYNRSVSSSSLVIYMLLFICLVSVVLTIIYIVMVRRKRRRASKETYTSVDYVILDNPSDYETQGISL